MYPFAHLAQRSDIGDILIAGQSTSRASGSAPIAACLSSLLIRRKMTGPDNLEILPDMNIHPLYNHKRFFYHITRHSLKSIYEKGRQPMNFALRVATLVVFFATYAYASDSVKEFSFKTTDGKTFSYKAGASTPLVINVSSYW